MCLRCVPPAGRLATEVLEAKRKKVADGRAVGRSVEKPTKEKPEASRPPFQGPADSVSLLPKPPRRLAKAERSFLPLLLTPATFPFHVKAFPHWPLEAVKSPHPSSGNVSEAEQDFLPKPAPQQAALAPKRSSEVARWRGQTPVSLGRGLQGAYTSSRVLRLTSALPAETTRRRARESESSLASKQPECRVVDERGKKEKLETTTALAHTL